MSNKPLIAAGILLAALSIVLALTYASHRYQLRQEAPLRTPLGQPVEVNGHHMSLYLSLIHI